MLFKFRKISKSILVLAFLLFHSTIVFGDTLEWSNLDVYKPDPILFLHGFASGNVSSWNSVIGGISKYFEKYATVTIDQNDLSRPFLERVNFNDPNGSIDTYDSGKYNPDGNSQGWADKVKTKMDGILTKYYYKNTALRVNIICHSMGGLAVREYITNPKYSCDISKIDKVITIGTPHAGSPLGNIRKEIIGSMNKYIIEYPPFAKITSKVSLSVNSNVIDLWLGDNKIDINGEAVKDMAYGSNFLYTLNYQRNQPSNIKKYAICGWIDIPLVNFLIYYPFYYEKTNYDFTKLSDLAVPYDSQRGYDIITNYPQENWVWQPDSIVDVNASHEDELVKTDTINYILQFLDSTPPEFILDSPQAGSTTEINTNSVSIKGRVFKEYLPADSQLIINVVRQEDGNTLSSQSSLLKPSGLWVPNNPDSPVAEFDETINLPGNGTYKISCQIKNPATLVSDIKDVWVKVSAVSTANIIVHCHNPEGKEINSIAGRSDVLIYDGDTTVGICANNAATHNQPINVSSGNHAIKVKFNGMTLEQNVDLQPNETKTLTFTFTRTEITDFLSFSFPSEHISNSWIDGTGGTWSWNILGEYMYAGAVIANSGLTSFNLTAEMTNNLSVLPTSLDFSGNFTTTFSGGNPSIDPEYPKLENVFFRNTSTMVQRSFPMPARSDFNNWIIQNFITQPSEVAIEVDVDGRSLFILHPNFELGYHQEGLPATQAYDKFRFYFDLQINKVQNVNKIATVEPFTVTVNAAQSLFLAGAKLKISSVPYDIQETAI